MKRPPRIWLARRCFPDPDALRVAELARARRHAEVTNSGLPKVPPGRAEPTPAALPVRGSPAARHEILLALRIRDGAAAVVDAASRNQARRSVSVPDLAVSSAASLRSIQPQ